MARYRPFPGPRVFAFTALLSAGTALHAQAPAAESRWDVTQPRGTTRTISFTTSEGTWMSVDIAPDGSWVVFDLLGHIYRMPITGGTATVLTQNSGVALNMQPRISPDGRTIAFITDRRGQYNLWVMDADGGNPRAVFTDLNATAFEPAWTPDGRFIVVRKGGRGGGEGAPPAGGLWMYHKDGGSGVPLVAAGTGGVNGAPAWPSISADGKHLYYQVSMNVDPREPLGGSQQLRRFTFADGEVLDITNGETGDAAASRFSSGGGAAPEISPDGRWLAFARHIPDGTLTFKGHQFGPRTALWLRDLKTGAERMLMDPIEPMVASGSKALGVLPRYKWAADGKSLVLMQGGKLRRVDASTGAVSTIPFMAAVQRTMSQMARREFRITDDPVQVKFFRWSSSSSDGRRLAFQALGRVYVQDGAAGTPRRVTPASFGPLEFAPAWSPTAAPSPSSRGTTAPAATCGRCPPRAVRREGSHVSPVITPIPCGAPTARRYWWHVAKARPHAVVR